jgi:hypothetical protein
MTRRRWWFVDEMSVKAQAARAMTDNDGTGNNKQALF